MSSTLHRDIYIPIDTRRLVKRPAKVAKRTATQKTKKPASKTKPASKKSVAKEKEPEFKLPGGCLPSLFRAALTIQISEVKLIVPHVSGVNRLLTIPVSEEFDSTRDQIHEHIGCQNKKRKPDLSYKLTQRGTVMWLGDDNSWQELCTSVGEKYKKSKGKTNESIHIIVNTDVRHPACLLG